MSNCSHHTACVDDALRRADKACHDRGVRLTKTRRDVLALLWQSHQPRKAYDLLAELGKNDMSAKPPTVYRALDFLLEQGLVHKVESLNAYIGCNGSSGHQYLICDACHTVSDIHDNDLRDTVIARARDNGFRVTSSVLEIKGLCGNCQ